MEEENAPLVILGLLCAPAIGLEKSGRRAIDCLLVAKRVVAGHRL
jgi:hypothetical protein